MVTKLVSRSLLIPCIISNLIVSWRLRVSSQERREDLTIGKLSDRMKLDDKIFLQDPLFTTIYDRVKISDSKVFQKPKNLSIAHSILLVEPYEDLLPIRPQLG